MTPEAATAAARISARLDAISAESHALARERALLHECLTRLRLGERLELIEARLAVLECAP